MKPRRIALLAAVTAAVVAVPAYAAVADDGVTTLKAEEVVPGVNYEKQTISTPHGKAVGHVLAVDLTVDSLELGLLTPGPVAATGVMTSLADRVEAAAGVNGDFFNIGETGAAVGPEILDGKDRKGPVPGKQRHGPTRPPGTDNDSVFGITADGKPVIDRLNVDGKATTPDGSFELKGLNQYAITVDGVGAFTSDWGKTSRKRATCGTDDDRDGPCSEQTREVEIVDGKVTRVADAPGEGEIAKDATVLVARDKGVDHLSGLAEGDEVTLDYQLASEDGADLDTALGGLILIDDGKMLDLNDDAGTLAPRTAVGSNADGTKLWMVAVDGRSSSSVGATVKSMADIMVDLGASQNAVNFDGGGSTTLVARKEGNTSTSVRNSPSDGSQRSVANGLGVFSAAA
ncbi:MAG: phosphodiester glycosidase family protein [Stackebrandtia sp.]